ncbi:MAG: twin-arginine translocase TatA/TatE family subunit [Alphaproteobacteria bacterium]|nr:twin-arginine translocase TatA/TatE family subunit [Alphaproteobacteria bacterium]MDD9920176.1 twin-arginine translocase TatA/TatE family subunit [Alphaproteobacteria bacterium]
MFGLGATELIIILVIVVLLFGAGRVTKVMGEMGKGVTAFKSGMKDGAAAESADKKEEKKD